MSLQLQTMPCCSFVKSDGQFSQCGSHYNADFNLDILVSFFFLLVALEPLPGEWLMQLSSIWKHFQNVFHFPDETLTQLFVPTLFYKNLQGAILNGVPADMVFCQGILSSASQITQEWVNSSAFPVIKHCLTIFQRFWHHWKQSQVLWGPRTGSINILHPECFKGFIYSEVICQLFSKSFLMPHKLPQVLCGNF